MGGVLIQKISLAGAALIVILYPSTKPVSASLLNATNKPTHPPPSSSHLLLSVPPTPLLSIISPPSRCPRGVRTRRP